jgi:2-methylfumaryl-CoA isomerase
VVELSAFVAAPLAGSVLASLGAEVIRIEQRGGGIDATRWPMHEGRSLYRSGLDKGKRSLTVDLSTREGQKLVVDLITAPGEGGGIVLTNLPVRGWMDFRELTQLRPDVIMMVISGASDGRAHVDYTVNARVGFPMITGPENGNEPVNHVLPAWDVTTALYTSTALLAAELSRRTSGTGQIVTLALEDVALTIADRLGYLAEADLIDEPRGRYGNAIFGTYGHDFRTTDGRYVMVCALTPRQWRSLCSATELTESFATFEASTGASLELEGDRFRHRQEITRQIEQWTSARTLEEVSARFDEHAVLWAPYRSFKELLRDEPRARSLPSSPLHFSAFSDSTPSGTHEIGADTDLVLREVLNLGDRDLEDLRSNGVID